MLKPALLRYLTNRESHGGPPDLLLVHIVWKIEIKLLSLQAGSDENEVLSMARNDIAKKWIEQVDEDILAAEALYNSGRWLYVGFLCHQAIEKTIKAYWLAMCDDEPLYLHNHFRLLEGCGLKEQLNEEQRRFIEIMSPMYIAARYPEYKNQVARVLNEKGCKYLINETKKLIGWILQKCSLETRPSILSDVISK